MKYVTDHFNLEMIKEPTYILVPKTLNRKKFLKRVKKSKSSIGSKVIAKLLHKPKEKQEIKLKRGDEIYIVTSEFGRNHSCEYTYNNNFRFEVFLIE